MVSLVKLKYFGIIIPFLLIFLMSHNTFATSYSSVDFFKKNWSVNNGAFSEVIMYPSGTNLPFGFVYNNNSYNSIRLQYYVASRAITSSASGKYFQIVVYNELVGSHNNMFNNSNCSGLSGYALPEQGSISNYTSRFECEVSNSGKVLNISVITEGSFSSSTSISSLYWLVQNSNNNLFTCSNYSGSMSPACLSPSGITFNSLNISVQTSEDPLVAGQNIIINQNDTIINQNQQMIDQENQAIDNIDNQSTSDISGAENQATSNLIGVLTNFFTQLQNFQATDCNLDLPFPQFIGGTQTVNICQGKDVLGNFITIIGTLAMVGFYIPLAWVLLKMIYNEIRSFTNG